MGPLLSTLLLSRASLLNVLKSPLSPIGGGQSTSWGQAEAWSFMLFEQLWETVVFVAMSQPRLVPVFFDSPFFCTVSGG